MESGLPTPDRLSDPESPGPDPGPQSSAPRPGPQRAMESPHSPDQPPDDPPGGAEPPVRRPRARPAGARGPQAPARRSAPRHRRPAGARPLRRPRPAPEAAVLRRPRAPRRLGAADRRSSTGLERAAAGELGQPRRARTLIDWLILLVPAVVLTLIVVAIAAGSDTGALVTGILGFLAYLVVVLVYAPVLMAREGQHNGQTWGKQMLGIRVVRDTRRADELRLVARCARSSSRDCSSGSRHRSSRSSPGSWTTCGRSGTTRTARLTTWSCSTTWCGRLAQAARCGRGAARRRRSRSSARGPGPTPTITIGTPRKSEMYSR